VKRLASLAFSVVALGCSNLTEGSGGVVGIDIRTPTLKTIEVGETLLLSAQALDKNGNPVSATITWRAPDPTLTVDQSGAITGVSPGTGRVQAFVGSLASSLESFTVIARADTLIVTDSLFTVAPGVAASAPLVTTVRSLSPAGPLPSWPVVYTVVSPTDNSVQLPGGLQVATIPTGTDGAVSSVTLTRLNAAQPATAIVEVRSFRTRGGTVPGSGQRFTVTFQ
jgi:hypothetical protein